MPSEEDGYEASMRSPSPKSARESTTKNLKFIDRLEHFTWAWYCFPMSTGGLALLIASQPHTFPGLHTIGKVVYIIDLGIFTLITTAITTRFLRFPGTLKSSLAHPTESLFFATSFLSLASIISGISFYGIPACGPWLIIAYRVLFWIYFAVTFIACVTQYLFLFTAPQLRIQDMTPAWDLPIFPFMLSGTVATAGLKYQPQTQVMPMLVAGVTGQGLGFIISTLMFASYLRRMIQYGLPSPASRPGMFISVGPASFTALALIGLAREFPKESTYFGDSEVTRQVVLIMATFSGIFMWSLSFWFFTISCIAVLVVAKDLRFHLNWWAFVFPNTGFTIATIYIGEVFGSQGVQWVGSVMSILLVATYLFVGCMHIRAVLRKRILWSGLDEDVHVSEQKGKRESRESDRMNKEEADGMLRQRKKEGQGEEEGDDS